MAASCTCSGAGKSGWPMQKLMMSLPWRARAVTSASTTKAFSVPRLAARRLTCGAEAGAVKAGIGLAEKCLLCRPMLINCVAYQDGRKLADIEKREISDYLQRPGCFVWVALREPSEGAGEERRENSAPPRRGGEDQSHGHQRPKIEEYG